MEAPRIFILLRFKEYYSKSYQKGHKRTDK